MSSAEYTSQKQILDRARDQILTSRKQEGQENDKFTLERVQISIHSQLFSCPATKGEYSVKTEPNLNSVNRNRKSWKTLPKTEPKLIRF